MSSLPLPGGVPHHLSVLSTGIAAIEVKHAEVADLLHEVAGPAVLFRNPNPTQFGDGSAVLMPFEEGTIYWSEGSGAHEQHGEIFDVYLGLGAEGSPHGLPLADVAMTDDGIGEIGRYQRGTIVAHPDAGTNEVHGAIHARWLALGAEHSFLGFPTSFEQAAADGIGRFNTFQNGSIYWHPDTGAFAINGPILARWKELGAETGYLGYPVSEEMDAGTLEGRRVLRFQNGDIFSRPDGGTLDVPHQVVFTSGPIVTDEALGGFAQLVVNSRGEYAYSGHLHNSGFFGLDFTVAAVLHGDGKAFVLPPHSANVDGHDPFVSGDEHDFNWQDNNIDPALRANWQTIKSAQLRIRVDIDMDFGQALGLVIVGIVIFGGLIFFASPGAKRSKQCPDGSVIFWNEGAPEPDCNSMF